MFLLLGIVPLSHGKTAHRPLPKEKLEKYGDSPMFIFRLGISPRMLSTFGAFTSYQVNVDENGHNITGDAANEPSISVDSADRDKKTIGWRQFDNVASNFRQAGWGYTNDAGVTWTFPGVLQPNVFRSDPVLSSDDSGHLFYLSLLTTFFDDMWRSLNGGQSWTNLAPATGGDKQWFTIDNTSSIGHGNQYQFWSMAGDNYETRQFSRSTDGGFTWLDPINIPHLPAWGTPDVDTTGRLFLGGVNLDTGQIWCERSTNARNGAVTPTFDQSTLVDMGGDIGSSQLINPEGLVGQIFLAVDHSGTSNNNHIYMLASILPPGVSGSDVMFVRSTDGGKTFSAPHRVNDDPINHSKWHWFAALSVAPNGRLDAVWLDTRNAANNTDSQLFYSYSTDAGDSWSPNVAVSASFNPFLGYPNQNKLGDYLTIVSDDTGGDVAYAATFNGEEDVYYARVAPLQSQFLNISTRAEVRTEDQVLIAGLIVGGTVPKQVLIRGIGPSLSKSGLTGVLANPTLELHQGNVTLETNDNWKINSDGTSQQLEIEATTIPPTNALESAILTTLSPGTYTAILAGKDGGQGIGLVEVYDLTATADSHLANISTRGFVNTDDNILIGGFIAGEGGGGGARVVLRALGPSLARAGVSDALADPTLELHDADGTTLATNDNWQLNDATGESQAAAVRATGLAPTNALESVIVTTLSPGTYTAVVRGKDNTTGVGLVEAYDLP
ncbi:MAG: exo-alpha-sialidase [Chthoniobacterales bacterium]|nr:exo-alpha-sialidase [Chthoniobacterales bacterium]